MMNGQVFYTPPVAPTQFLQPTPTFFSPAPVVSPTDMTPLAYDFGVPAAIPVYQTGMLPQMTTIPFLPGFTPVIVTTYVNPEPNFVSMAPPEIPMATVPQQMTPIQMESVVIEDELHCPTGTPTQFLTSPSPFSDYHGADSDSGSVAPSPPVVDSPLPVPAVHGSRKDLVIQTKNLIEHHLGDRLAPALNALGEKNYVRGSDVCRISASNTGALNALFDFVLDIDNFGIQTGSVHFTYKKNDKHKAPEERQLKGLNFHAQFASEEIAQQVVDYAQSSRYKTLNGCKGISVVLAIKKSIREANA